jgi:carbamoyl-phosphate synthase large subunit
VTIPKKHLETIETYTRKIAMELEVIGLMNIQYAISNGVVYVLEANPRASRTVPLVSKVCAIPMARLATQIILGKGLSDLGLKRKEIKHFGIKQAVFAFNMFPEVDPVLGPEMRSTGEVLAMADSFGLAFYKSQEAAGSVLPLKGTVLITVADRDKQDIVSSARRFREMGFRILATQGTKRFLEENKVDADHIRKTHEGRPHIVDMIKNREIHLIINTPHGKVSEVDDSYIRKNAVKYKIPYITTATAALAAAKGIEARRKQGYSLKSLQEYHRSEWKG